MPINPNGQCMDVLRACYRTRMRFFRDSDLEIPVTWYWCEEGALPFPGHTVFGSGNWATSRDDWVGPGEVGGAPRPFYDGHEPLNWVGNFDEYVTFGGLQDPHNLQITIELDRPHDFRFSEEIYIRPAIPPNSLPEGWYPVINVPDGLHVTIQADRLYRPRFGEMFVSAPAIWGRFRGQFFFGALQDFEQGCIYDATENSYTTEDGLQLDCMRLPPECWLTIIAISNAGATPYVEGDVIHFRLLESLPGYYLHVTYQSDETYQINQYHYLPLFVGDQVGLALGLTNGMDFTGLGTQEPTSWSNDQRSFWYVNYGPAQPQGPPFCPDERWYCVLTFDDPRISPPGPAFPYFPPAYFNPQYWPSNWGF